MLDHNLKVKICIYIFSTLTRYWTKKCTRLLIIFLIFYIWFYYFPLRIVNNPTNICGLKHDLGQICIYLALLFLGLIPIFIAICCISSTYYVCKIVKSFIKPTINHIPGLVHFQIWPSTDTSFFSRRAPYISDLGIYHTGRERCPNVECSNDSSP